MTHICVSKLTIIGTAPSHYLGLCWDIVNWTIGNKLQWNRNRNLHIFIPENAFENVVRKLAADWLRPQCVNLIVTGLLSGICPNPCLIYHGPFNKSSTWCVLSGPSYRTWHTIERLRSGDVNFNEQCHHISLWARAVIVFNIKESMKSLIFYPSGAHLQLHLINKINASIKNTQRISSTTREHFAE